MAIIIYQLLTSSSQRKRADYIISRIKPAVDALALATSMAAMSVGILTATKRIGGITASLA